MDEISCYAFAVKPKKLESGKRYFEGEVWVDDRDLQIVKTYGRGVGITHGDYQYPKFETYREQIDGKYWFPTYTIANTTLHFKENDQRIKETVKYEDYKQFKSDTTIKYETDDHKTRNSTGEEAVRLERFQLPIDGLLPRIRESLASSPNLVIEAPPGAGKTTRVPPALLDLVRGNVLVLEPGVWPREWPRAEWRKKCRSRLAKRSVIKCGSKKWPARERACVFSPKAF